MGEAGKFLVNGIFLMFAWSWVCVLVFIIYHLSL